MQPLPTRAITALIVALLVVSACSNDDDIADLPPEDPSTTTTSSTTSTQPTTTSSTTTTLSETQAAEAEIEQLLIDWWTGADDGLGPDGGTEYLTGLIETRVSELAAEEQAQGYESSNSQNSVIQVTSIAVDLEQGTAEATSCTGSAVIQRSSADNAIVFADDPTFLFTSDWIVVLTDEGWKISDWFPSANADEPEPCTIEDT